MKQVHNQARHYCINENYMYMDDFFDDIFFKSKNDCLLRVIQILRDTQGGKGCGGGGLTDTVSHELFCFLKYSLICLEFIWNKKIMFDRNIGL